MRSYKTYLPLIAAVVVLLGVFRLWVPQFLTTDNLLDLAQQISVNAILAFGMTLVILIGGIDLSVGAVVALVGTVTVWLLPRAGLVPSVAAGLGVAMLCRRGQRRVRRPDADAALHHHAGDDADRPGAALRFNEGRPISVPAVRRRFLALGNAQLFGLIPLPVLLMAAAFAASWVLLHQTRFGQHLYAIGGNREAARLVGIPLARHETAVYVLCSLFAGLSGLIHASQLYAAEPGSGQGFELNAIAAVVVGGTSFTGGIGSVPGTLLGAVIIGILDKGLNQAGVHFSLQSIVKGSVILAAVYVDVPAAGVPAR